MARKIPHCKICDQDGHYAYACWQNPRRGYNLRKKYEKAYKTGKVPRREKTLSKETTKRKQLIMELDKYCSLIVRIKASNKYGVANCYICGKRLPYKQMHNGHFKSRQFLGTRFDWDNMRCCCPECNVVLHGNIPKYKIKLVNEIGEERVNNLEKKKSLKPTTPELEELLKEMKIKYKELIEEKKKPLML